MAHSDALIFLTSITWIFFLFLFTYFFFVIFFLPTLYKKFRIRVLLKSTNYLGAVLSARSVLVTLVFFVEAFKGFSLLAVSLFKKAAFFFKTSGLALSAASALNLEFSNSNSFAALSKYKSSLITTELPLNSSGIVFTKYTKI